MQSKLHINTYVRHIADEATAQLAVINHCVKQQAQRRRPCGELAASFRSAYRRVQTITATLKGIQHLHADVPGAIQLLQQQIDLHRSAFAAARV